MKGQKHIFIIEDNDMIRENVVDILTIHDFKITAFSDGNIAIKEIKKIKPDLVLCDIMMPALPGYKVLEALKDDVATAMIPFIFVTSKSEKTDVRSGMDLGADDYLTKPFTIKELISTVNARLEKAEKEKNSFNYKLDDLSHIISHEYNTPLNGILGLTSLLADNENNISADDAAAYLASINKAGERLKKTNERLINFINIEKTALIANSKTLNSNDALAYVYKAASNFATKYQRLQDYQITPNITLADFSIINSDCFYIIIDELLDNCFKYALSNTMINIQLTDVNETLALKITNEGVFNSQNSTSEAGLKKYFESKNGFGIGLYMVDKINKLLNLDFNIQQKGTEVETTIKFNISIPN